MDTATDEVVRTVQLIGHEKAAQIARYSPDGKYLIVTSYDAPLGTIFDAKLETQKLLQLGRGPMNMAFHPDGCTLLTANHDAGSLAVIDLERAEVIRTVPAGVGVETYPFIEANMKDWLETAREADYTPPGFKFAVGGELDVRLHYRTLGALAPDRGNAVLMLHGTVGSSKQFLQPSVADFLFAPDRPLDAGKYFIIFPDAIGHGGSSKPSDGLETAFPRYCYADIVEAQHRLVTAGLGLKRLRLVLGTSMGGMQTWTWGERYPDMMDALLPVASLPERVDGRNLLWRRLLMQIARLARRTAASTERPTSLGLAWNLFPPDGR